MSTKPTIHRRDAMKLTALGLAGAMSAPAAPRKWPVKPSSNPFGGLKGWTHFLHHPQTQPR